MINHRTIHSKLFEQRRPSTNHFSYNFYQNTYVVANVVTGVAQLFATGLISYKAWCVP